MDRKIFVTIIAALAMALAVWLFALLAAPVAMPVAWALIIGVPTMPYYDRVRQRWPQHPQRAAAAMVGVVTLCVVVPLAVLVLVVAQNAAGWYDEVQRLIEDFRVTGQDTLEHFPFVSRILALGDRYGIDLAGWATKLAAGASGFILDAATSTAKNLASLLFTVAVALFILFFIYRDGERVVAAGVDRFATDRQKVRRYLSSLRATTTAVAVGTVFTCLAQGVTAGVAYVVAGVPAPFLCAALTAVAALVPVVGTAVVWVPLVVLLAFNAAYIKALLLALWCIFFVGLADNAIRPLAIGATSDISTLAIVLGAISGVNTLGLLGLLIGPIVFASLFTLWSQVTVGGEPDDKEAVHSPKNP